MSGPLETGDHCLPSHRVHLQPRSVIDCGTLVHCVHCRNKIERLNFPRHKLENAELFFFRVKSFTIFFPWKRR